MGAQGGEQGGDALQQAIVDYALIFEGLDLVLALEALLVDLVLFGADEGPFVDVGMDLDVGVIAELQIVLCTFEACQLLSIFNVVSSR